jgi:hypothetical protein
MSLTSLLHTEDVRRRFREEFEKPSMEETPDLIAPPLTDRPGHVGTAFDYLLRFHVRRLNPNLVHARQWVAESAVERLTGNQKEDAQLVIEQAKAARDAYVASGELTNKLLELILGLARLDLVVRTGGNVSLAEVDAVRDNDVNDLRHLHQIIPDQRFRVDNLSLLNPTFGKASALAGGADADLLIDETLIDVKTVREAKLTREMFNQLLGYYTLHIIGGIGDLEPKPKITQVGVYFSRFGHLHSLNLDSVVDRCTYPDFVEWFAKYCIQKQLQNGSDANGK